MLEVDKSSFPTVAAGLALFGVTIVFLPESSSSMRIETKSNSTHILAPAARQVVPVNINSALHAKFLTSDLSRSTQQGPD
ncbi:MAG: hypothetical protein KKB42_04505 [Gammaproteobacteria bacterium]|nr:hypothetical protein [Gammaproteobacteria bacterium]MBU4170433.1 hypothetical protein [Gammaproteobacteria bacterium]